MSSISGYTHSALPKRVGRFFNAAFDVKYRLHMNSKRQCTYKEAISALNCLQSNSAYIQKARLVRNHKPDENLINTAKHLNSLGIKVEDLNSLNIIHVSGTKGKGSTCAFTESILRTHGVKTGFYSSPHLISVNERIRINGQPLNKEVFTCYFWHVFDTLQQNLKDHEKMPAYFMFMTLMAFYVFLKEKVDAAVIEVGIGGLYDCTNVVPKPVVVGVTTLGLDHVQLLGNTIAKIAEQKAGIFKPSVPAFSVPQPENAMTVLQKQSELVGCSFHITPPFEAYEQKNNLFDFGLLSVVQNLNASLALQLSHTWFNREKFKSGASPFVSPNLPYDQKHSIRPVSIASSFPLDTLFINGLQSCSWPGRFHILKKNNYTYYLDGAHTQQSMKHCMRWFEGMSQLEKSKINGSVCRVLLFNCTGERTAETLLSPLSELYFDVVLFSPNRMQEIKDVSSDQSNFTVDPNAEMNRCQENRDIWCHLMSSFHEDSLAITSEGFSGSFSFSCCRETQFSDSENTRLFTCLENVLKWLNGKSSDQSDIMLQQLNQADHVQVLVTGSLHLVGGVLSVIDPDLISNTHYNLL